MEIAVCIKQTPDTESHIRLDAARGTIDERDLTWVISPHDESAVEQALQLRQAHGGAVTVITLGPSRAERAVREALALGADDGVHLLTEVMPEDAAVVAPMLAEELARRTFDLVLMGEQSIDQGGFQMPQRVSALLGWPCVTAVESLVLDGGRVRTQRPIDQDQLEVAFTLPGVIGINRRIGEPRYPSFKGIRQAKRKPIVQKTAALAPSRMATVALRLPPSKPTGVVKAFGSGMVVEVAALLAGKVQP